jgi:hypothetical protein
MQTAIASDDIPDDDDLFPLDVIDIVAWDTYLDNLIVVEIS